MNNRTVEQGVLTRKRIMQAAADLFGRHGYRGCSLAQIARAADVGQSNVLHHFGSKERLLTEILEEQFQVHEEVIERISQGETNLADRFDSLAAAALAAPEFVQLFSVMAGESLTEGHPARQFFERRYDLVRERYVTAVLEHARSLGRPEAAEEVSHLVNILVATLDGLQLQWLRNPQSVDIARGMAEITNMVRDRLGAP